MARTKSKYGDHPSEKEIELAFIAWFKEIDVIEYLGNQVRIQAGIVDAIFYDKSYGRPIVAEVKRGKAPASVVAQLIAYMNDIHEVVMSSLPYRRPYYRTQEKNIYPQGLIIAADIDEKTVMAVAASHEIDFVQYTINSGKIEFSPASILEPFSDKHRTSMAVGRLSKLIAGYLEGAM